MDEEQSSEEKGRAMRLRPNRFGISLRLAPWLVLHFWWEALRRMRL